MNRQLHIGLLWHSDNNMNLGVGALTVGNMALVRKACEQAGVEPLFHMFQVADPGPVYVTEGVAGRYILDGKYMTSPSGYWRDLGKLDLMLDIGAGDSFADIYPDKRFAYIIATKALCLWRGVPLVLSPQTIGPFSRQPHIVLASRMMRKARAVFARDPMSFEAIGKLAPDATAKQAIDVAFALPFTPAPKGPGVRVGVNVSGLLYSGGYGGQNDYGLSVDYKAFTERLVAGLLARGARVELISHVTTPLARDDDVRAAEAVHQLFPEALVVPAFASPSAAKSYISGLDFLVAARMHASIAAWSSGVPVLPVSYSRKFEGLYRALDYPWMVPPKGLSTEEAVAMALDAFERRAELQADIGRGQQAVTDGLESYVGYLAGLFTELKR